MKFRNPILPGFYPDPSLCRVGEDFFLTTSTFEYFPGLPIFHSRDLVNWRQIGHALDRPSQLPLKDAGASGGLYAPTLRHHAGTFYLTCTNVSGGGNFIVTAKDAAGPWSEPLWVAQQGIDPSLFFDEDGSVYYTSSHFGALQAKLDLATGRLLTEPRVVWKGTGAQHAEAPHLFRRKDWYYMVMAEGGTEYGHMVVMARSRSPWGPFEPCPRNPLLTHRSFWSPIQALGHADLVESARGVWYAVCLGIRPVGYPPCYHLGRETFLCPLSWDDWGDGFPVFGQAGRLSLEMEGGLAEPLAPAGRLRDDFEGPRLDFSWVHLRNPDPALYSLGERPGFLRLKGSAAGLGETASPAWLGRRQTHFDLKVSTCLEFDPRSEGEEAGLCVHMNERHHYEIFVSRRQGQASVVLRRRIGSLQAEVASRPLRPEESKRLLLGLKADKDSYSFLAGPDEKSISPLGQGETRYLSTEVAGGFTGVMLALYASGNGKPCAGPADFDWFDYEVL